MGKKTFEDDYDIYDDSYDEYDHQIIDQINKIDWITEIIFLKRKINGLIKFYKKYDDRFNRLTLNTILINKKINKNTKQNTEEFYNLASDIHDEILHMEFKHRDIIDNINDYKLINDDLYTFYKMFFNKNMSLDNIFNKLCYYCI